MKLSLYEFQRLVEMLRPAQQFGSVQIQKYDEDTGSLVIHTDADDEGRLRTPLYIGDEKIDSVGIYGDKIKYWVLRK